MATAKDKQQQQDPPQVRDGYVPADPADSDDLKVRAGAVVLPEYERRIAEASAAGDQDLINEVQDEYSKKRTERAKKRGN